MAEGTIKRLTDKGFGFIETSPGKDIFFHMSAVQGVRFEDLRQGQRVSFTESMGPTGAQGREREAHLSANPLGASAPMRGSARADRSFTEREELMVGPKNSVNDRKTLVEEGTLFKGSLSSTCPIEVNGRFEGDLAAPALVVNPGGAVHGSVRVRELKSQGELAGNFDAEVACLSGTVKDETLIRAKSLEVKLTVPRGAMRATFKDSQIDVGDQQPSKEKPGSEA
jgi:CspA family cold shock protein